MAVKINSWKLEPQLVFHIASPAKLARIDSEFRQASHCNRFSDSAVLGNGCQHLPSSFLLVRRHAPDVDPRPRSSPFVLGDRCRASLGI